MPRFELKVEAFSRLRLAQAVERFEREIALAYRTDESKSVTDANRGVVVVEVDGSRLSGAKAKGAPTGAESLVSARVLVFASSNGDAVGEVEHRLSSNGLGSFDVDRVVARERK